MVLYFVESDIYIYVLRYGDELDGMNKAGHCVQIRLVWLGCRPFIICNVHPECLLLPLRVTYVYTKLASEFCLEGAIFDKSFGYLPTV
jgi:hypothetical protein